MAETGHEQLGQGNFQETPYGDATWEIVGAPPTEQTFTPVQLEVIPSSRVDGDAMFSDYGGFSALKGRSTRWHLPEELAAEKLGESEARESKMERMVMDHANALEVMEKRAFEQGKKAATAEMEKQSQQQLSVISERVTIVLTDLRRQLEEEKIKIEGQSVDLAIAIAKQLIRGAVEFNPEYILPIVKQGIEQAGGAMVRCVKVSKEDLEFLTLAGALVAIPGAGETWDFVADDSVKSGCIVETASGEIDLQLEPAFERIRHQVLKAVR